MRDSRTVYLKSAASIFLVLAFGVAAAETGESVSLSVKEMPLAEALGRVAAQAGVDIEIVGDHDFQVSASFSDLPLVFAVREVLAGESFAVAGPRPGVGDGERAVLTVVLGNGSDRRASTAANRLSGDGDATPTRAEEKIIAERSEGPADVGAMIDRIAAENPKLARRVSDLIETGESWERDEIVAILEESGEEGVRFLLDAYEDLGDDALP